MARSISTPKEPTAEPHAPQAAPAAEPAPEVPPAADGAPRGEVVATTHGLRPPMTEAELRDLQRVQVQSVQAAAQQAPVNREAYPVPEHDVYARDGMLASDPRARRAPIPQAKLLEPRDNRIAGKAKHVEGSPPAKQYRVAANAQVIGPNGMPMTIRAGKIVTERTHDVERLKRQGVQLVDA